MKDDIEKFAKSIGLASAILLLTAVAFNYGYFQKIGIVWITKLTIQDHFNTAVRYLATFAYGQMMAGILCWSQKFARINYESKVSRVINAIGLFVAIAGLAVAVLNVEGQYRVLAVALIIIFLWLSFYEYTIWKLQIIPTLTTSALLQVGPVALVLTMLFGYTEAEWQKNMKGYMLTLELPDNRFLVDLKLITIITDGILAEDLGCQCVIFVPHSEVKQIRLN